MARQPRSRGWTTSRPWCWKAPPDSGAFRPSPHLHPPLLHPGGGIANPPPAPGPGGPGLPCRPADLPGDPPWRFLGDAVLHQRLLWGRRGQLHDRLHLRPRDCRLSEHRPAGSGQPDPHHGGLPGPLPPELPGGQALRHSPPGRPGLWPPGPAVLAASAAVAAGAGGGSGPGPGGGGPRGGGLPPPGPEPGPAPHGGVLGSAGVPHHPRGPGLGGDPSQANGHGQ